MSRFPLVPENLASLIYVSSNKTKERGLLTTECRQVGVLNTLRDFKDVTERARARAAVTEKARLPIVDSNETVVISAVVDAERSRCNI